MYNPLLEYASIYYEKKTLNNSIITGLSRLWNSCFFILKDLQKNSGPAFFRFF